MIKSYSFVLLRTPLQSLNLANDFSAERQTLLQEGIYLSSPEFWKELLKENDLTAKEKEKLELSFAKYWLRSCSRCTPYGTLAGVKLIAIKAEETNLQLDHADQHIRSVRLDMNYLNEMITYLNTVPEIVSQLKFYTNNSLYELPDSYRYATYSLIDTQRVYELTSIKKTNYITDILLTAQKGATLESLAQILKSHENISLEEAAEFIADMVDSQLILSDLEPCVTGKDPLNVLIEQLETLHQVDELLLKLKGIQQLIKNPKAGVGYYKEIEDSLKALDFPIQIPSNLLQTDLFFAAKAHTIDQSIIDRILKQTEDLYALSLSGEGRDLNNFKSKFSARYEFEEVPLSFALDAELGIGYAGSDQSSAGENSLVENLTLKGPVAAKTINFDYIQEFVLHKHNDYLQHQKTTIEITEEELKSFKPKVTNYKFSNSLHLMGSLLKSGGKLDAENFIFELSSFGGTSSGNLLSRFAHGDQQLCDFTKEILKEEEKEFPDHIYADIVHLPQARVGNVLLRPLLRNYEIPYIGKSGLTAENQIPVEDIMVCVKNNKVLLRSRKHNKYIIPKLTSAHNFSTRSLPVYKFLCDLQTQGQAQPDAWNWGVLSSLTYLPRVVYKNLIVRKARWILKKEELPAIPKERNEYLNYCRALRIQYHIPQKVAYVEHDNKLLIDLEELAGADLFIHYLKRYESVQLEEFLFTNENCIVCDANGNPHTNELIIPLKREDVGLDKSLVNHALKSDFTSLKNEIPVKRKFSPFSEWLFFKIYCGPTAGEKILKNELLEFVEDGIRQNLFEKFHFIRYIDESFHIRVRFYNSDLAKQLKVQQQFMEVLEPLLASNLISKVVLDTYSRELERYGAPIIAEVESLFFNDSLAVLKFARLLDSPELEEYRFLFALRGADMLLTDFGYTILEKKELLKRLQMGFFREFGGDPALQKQLNEKYRQKQKNIFLHMNADLDELNEIEEAVAVYKKRSAMNRLVYQTILLKSGNQTPPDHLMESLLHMYLNRLLVNNPRKHELVIYHFLEKYYSSQLAISTHVPKLAITQ
ncbi:lantibiotic dehydratase [Pedobacter sp. WC2423]|uniref:lantibiotic dehydratase n=1 Tax=Pedobacter sp. WC2423 TaxID=3234142 RepID=UPI0034665260